MNMPPLQYMASPPAKPQDPEWTRNPERGTYFGLVVMRWLSLSLGRRISRSALHFAVAYFVATSPSVRRASRAYLRRCLKRNPNLGEVYRHVYAFASTIHDRVYIFNGRHDLFDLRITGAGELQADIANHGGVLLLGAHFGSFEMARAASRHFPDLKVYMAMYPDNARKLRNTLAAISPSATQDIIDLGRIDALLTAHLRLSEGAVVGILADRAIRSDDFVPIPFLEEPAYFPTGPFRFAALLRRPVYFIAGIYREKNRYTIHFERLSDPVHAPQDRQARADQIRRNYVSALERQCRSAPYNWFNFYDFWQPPAQNR